MRIAPFPITLAAFILVAPLARAAPVRLKDLVDAQGVRVNELIGYGLVTGLSGTGDTQQVFFTQQTLSGMLGRLGVRVDPRDIRARNVAAVMVTARLPTFARPGSHVDVSVSSMGNARSLTGGVLLLTALNGPDGQVYALAQGPVQVGGYDVSAAGSSMRKNSPNAGRIPSGATIERSVAPKLDGPLVLVLKEPDFTNATRIAKAVQKALGPDRAKALDPAAVEVSLGGGEGAEKSDAVALMAQLEALEVDPDQRAKVVVNERTGTVVAGDHVRLRPAAVAHGDLRVAIGQSPVVSQPSPFARVGSTVNVPVASVDVDESSRGAVALPATTTVEELVKALNTLGATPRDLIAILQALKVAGALDAELEVSG